MLDRFLDWVVLILKGQFWLVSVIGNSKFKYYLFFVGFYKYDVERQYKYYFFGFF